MAVALIGFGMATARWFLWPSDDDLETGSADAVVLFAGGRGERLDEAMRLMDAGVAPHLVIMNGRLEGWTRANALCHSVDSDSTNRSFEVTCPTPDPDTTRGEARLTAALADDAGWSSVVVVTSDYHLHRARTLAGRCLAEDIELLSSAGTGNVGVVKRTRHIAHEWLATAATWFDRGC